jgi:hypothetical protein
MKSKIYFLIKVFDDERYADAFIKSGEMFCRTLGEFKRINDESGRGDPFEAVTDCHQPDRISLRLKFRDKDGIERDQPIVGLAGPLIIQNKGYDRLNLYCMYATKISEFSEAWETEDERVAAIAKIDASLQEQVALSDNIVSLGKYAVVIYQVGEFIEKVKKAAVDRGFTCWSGPVTYYDPDTFHGSFDEVECLFKKRKSYEYQNEFRFVLGSHEPDGAKLIHLGPLDGIAFKIPTAEINQNVQLRLAE